MLNGMSDAVGSFVALLLTLAEFNQCPSRMTDMIFFLARAVKLLKKNIEDHPNQARPARVIPELGGEELHEKLTPLEELKIALLQELFSALLFESRDKRILLEDVRSGHLKDVL